MPAYTTLTGFTNSQDASLLEMLEQNLKEFFEWGLLEAGFYNDFPIYSLGVAGAAPENLIPVQAPNAMIGQTWQGVYRNWTYERNLESVRQPIVASGVYVNGTFHNTLTSTGTYQHYINFPAGQVVFNNAIDVNSVVQANYSAKSIAIYDEDVPWFKNVIFDAFNYNQPTINLPSGFYSLLDQNSVQVPFILIESVPDRKMVPKQLGDISHYIYQDFLFHIVADKSSMRNQLVDIITLQENKQLFLYDINYRDMNNNFTLDYKGSPLPSGKFYNQLVEPPPLGYQFKRGFFETMTPQSVSTALPLFRAVIRVSFMTDYI